MKNNIDELRGALFDTLRDLRAGKIDVDRAKAVNETAQVLINSVKAEIDHMRIAGGKSSFVCIESDKPALFVDGAPASLAIGESRTTPTKHGQSLTTRINGAGTQTTHRML